MPISISHRQNVQPKLLVSIDFGTAYSSVAFYIDRRPVDERNRTLALGEIPPSRLNVVRFHRDAQVSSQLGWCRDSETWAWGRAVDDLVDSGDILESERIQMFKLCLESSDMAKGTRERVKDQFDKLPPLAKKQLGPENIPWPERLVSLYLQFLWRDAKVQIASNGIKLKDHDIACWLGVPKFVANILYVCMDTD